MCIPFREERSPGSTCQEYAALCRATACHSKTKFTHKKDFYIHLVHYSWYGFGLTRLSILVAKSDLVPVTPVCQHQRLSLRKRSGKGHSLDLVRQGLVRLVGVSSSGVRDLLLGMNASSSAWCLRSRSREWGGGGGNEPESWTCHSEVGGSTRLTRKFQWPGFEKKS